MLDFLNSSFNKTIFSLILFLTVASTISFFLGLKFKDNSTIKNLKDRINAWWLIVLICAPCLYLGLTAITILFYIISSLAFKEYISINKLEDKNINLFCYFFVIPIQFFLVWYNWYGLFTIFIPVYIFFIIGILNTLNGTTENFLIKTANLQWGIFLTIYGLSYIPELFQLKIKNYESHANIILYFIIVTQLSDVFQYICGKLFGKNSLSKISPNKTWEGLIGGGICAIIVGIILTYLTPFNYYQSAIFSFILVINGFFGGFILSAVKRSINAKDWGNLIKGHGGILDRVDSLALSAPIFFHLIRYFFTN